MVADWLMSISAPTSVITHALVLVCLTAAVCDTSACSAAAAKSLMSVLRPRQLAVLNCRMSSAKEAVLLLASDMQLSCSVSSSCSICFIFYKQIGNCA